MGGVMRSLGIGRSLGNGFLLARSFFSTKTNAAPQKTLWIKLPGVSAPKFVNVEDDRSFKKFLKGTLHASGLTTDGGLLVTDFSMLPETSTEIFTPIKFSDLDVDVKSASLKTVTVTYPDPTSVEMAKTHTLSLANDQEFKGLVRNFSPACLFPQDERALSGPLGNKPVFSLAFAVDGGHYSMEEPTLYGSLRTIQNHQRNVVKGDEVALTEAVKKRLEERGWKNLEIKEGERVVKDVDDNDRLMYEVEGVIDADGDVRHVVQHKTTLDAGKCEELLLQLQGAMESELVPFQGYARRDCRLIIAAHCVPPRQLPLVHRWSLKTGVPILLRSGSDWEVGSAQLLSAPLTKPKV